MGGVHNEADSSKRKNENAFTSIWNNTEPNIVTMDFPNVKDEIIKRYRKGSIIDPDSKEFGDDVYISRKSNTCWISKPDNVKFYDYQIDAMISWENEKYRGIFDMATGTGKTYTALGALEVLSNKVKSNLGIFIVCPYQHLVEQWVADIKAFGIAPLICYSGYNWKKKFRSMLSDFKLGVIQNFCIVTTNVTFATDNMQEGIDKLKGNVCLVVDEAHNFGARKQLGCMKEVFKYRLALSATLERHHDDEGTQKLKDYFGNKCIEYSLARAIKEGKLTPYYYYPIPIYLDDDELEAYNELILERATNGGAFAQIYKGTSRAYTDSITFGWTTVQYRVKAYDNNAAESAYTATAALNVVNSKDPVINGTDSDLGLKTAAFNQTYSVTNPDAPTIPKTLTVVERIDGKQKRSFTATSGSGNTFAVTAAEWTGLANGSHTLTITATDNYGGTATRTFTFSKSVTEIEFTLSTPLPADAAVSKAIMNVARQIPVGAEFSVEVCNNAFDASPAWEDVTNAVVSGNKFFLENATKTATNWGFNIRVRVKRKSATGECYISGMGGNFE